MLSSLVVTVVGPDRPGMVSAISDCAGRFGANWADSLMANFAGQFAGIVHVQVASEHCDALITALRALESPRLTIGIVRGGSAQTPGDARRLRLQLVGHDRPGIIHSISAQLAARGISIEKLQTELQSGAWSGEQMFRMNAVLFVPATLDTKELRGGLEGLANELMADITLE